MKLDKYFNLMTEYGSGFTFGLTIGMFSTGIICMLFYIIMKTFGWL